MSEGMRRHTATQKQAQARAQWAWSAVDAAVKGPENKRPEYATEVRKLPARLLGSGLGQTLAYLFSKRKPAERGRLEGRSLLYQQISDRIGSVLGRGSVGEDGAMAIVVALSASQYRHLSRELLDSAEWLKRFADGRLEDETDDGDAGGGGK